MADTATTTTQQLLSPQQEELLGQITPIASQFLAQPPQLFPRSAIAPQDPLQLAAQRAALGATGTQQGVSQDATSASNFLLSPEALSPTANPALQAFAKAATRPVFEGLNEAILPNIRGEAITSGQFGG